MKCAVIVFVKFPEAGKVKTRLGKDIGYEAAAKLYSAFVGDILHNLDESGFTPIIAFDSFQPEDKYKEWLGNRTFIQQQGNDLGERMHKALQEGFNLGFDVCILTGSDLPDLDPEFVHQAEQALKKAPACIGPASDGGYYLIGFQKEFLTDYIFNDMEWSTESVFNETISRLEKLSLNPAILPKHQDMDTVEDLKRLRWNPSSQAICPRTSELLKTILKLNY
ncbi:TIGR04282 family arsenosugar biosynthesis glycosyltransferase [Maridesulfovibrio sp.]|uniref:TIGR04282 family arsenosugar biosynthesis glycosyltransferase n=1 Tax=Maridesulfovibrio sp. TaxID=2795000 RepID=UPI002A18A75F|nr:TIGR04282 family arsenosugar biosynthesis glycosyltransferase [Maridesulfovibrio sp.]